jgi:hypothetical protein
VKFKNHYLVFLTVLFLLFSVTLFSGHGSDDGNGNQSLSETSADGVMTSCTRIPRSIMAWFPFDETSGNIAYNMNGPVDGYLKNGPQHEPGKVDYALKLDGYNDYVEVAHHSRVDFGMGDFTFEAWVKTSDSYGNIVSKRYYHNSPGYLFMVYAGTLLLQMTDDINGWFNYIDPRYRIPGAVYPRVDDNQWHHVAVTVDRDNSQGGKMFIDGVVVYTFNPTNRQGSLDTDANLWIGQEGGGGQYFYGLIDELSLYNKALGKNKIIKIYQAGAEGKCKTKPLSLSLKVNARRKIMAAAKASGGTGQYTFTWHCSLNLKLLQVFTHKQRSRAIFKRMSNSQQAEAWVEVTVLDELTQQSLKKKETFLIGGANEPTNKF